MKKVYVAAKWEERERAHEVMTILRTAGHVITYDWTNQEQESQAQAECDRSGVLDAEVFVLLAEKDLPMRGAWVEFGIAVTKRIPIYVLGAYADPCIFLQLPFVRRINSLAEIV